MSFAHEELQVYQKGLEVFDTVQPFLSAWSKQHAFVDHLSRALESILFNLVEATRLRIELRTGTIPVLGDQMIPSPVRTVP